MEFPLFIDVEFSTPDDGAFPTAISWSLPNGQIKSALIIPDDDWEPWDNSNGEVDIQFLFDQGVSGPDVIRELNSDLDGQTVFVDGLDEDECLLELLYETYGNEFSFELATITQLFTSEPLEKLLSLRNELAHEHQLDLDNIEDSLRSLLYLYRETKK